MIYIQAAPNEYVKYDETTKRATVLLVNDIEVRKAEFEAQLLGLPKITDEFLLNWAIEHQEEVDEIRLKRELEAALVVIDEDLSNIAALTP